MSRHPQFTEWQGELARRFSHLPRTVVAVLAVYSLGVIATSCCGLSCVALYLASLLGFKFNSIRKRLSEFYKDKEDKSGSKRRDLEVSGCFAPLLGWLISMWPSKQLPLAIDVTNLGDRFHVLCISLVVRGTAIPVAWKVIHGGLNEPWGPHWNTLLDYLSVAVPEDWTVLILSDRGLESPELFRHITKLHWHPMMRIKKGGKFRPKGWKNFYYLHELVDRLGKRFAVRGCAYAGERLECTLLASWQEEQHEEPWLVLTDLPPESANVLWYGLRTWIEQGFKVIKGGGWQWDNTRMEDPERVERLWLVLAVSSLWVTALGAEEEVRREMQAELAKLQKELEEGEQRALNEQQKQQARQQAAHKARQRREEKARKRQEARDAAKKAKKAKKKTGQKSTSPAPTPGSEKRKKQKKLAGKQRRLHRIFRRGRILLTTLWQKGENRLPCCLYPEPWPEPVPPDPFPSEDDFLARSSSAPVLLPQQTYP